MGAGGRGGERPSPWFGGEWWTLLAGASSSHGFGSPSLGLAGAVGSPELGLSGVLPLVSLPLGPSQLTAGVGCHPLHPSSLSLMSPGGDAPCQALEAAPPSATKEVLNIHSQGMAHFCPLRNCCWVQKFLPMLKTQGNHVSGFLQSTSSFGHDRAGAAMVRGDGVARTGK